MKRIALGEQGALSQAVATLIHENMPVTPHFVKAFFLGAGAQYNEMRQPSPQPVGDNLPLYPDPVWAAADRLATQIAPIYKMLNWKWADENAVPEVRHIREALLGCWSDLQQDPEADMVECGGVYCEEIGEGVYQFGFELTEVIEEA